MSDWEGWVMLREEVGPWLVALGAAGQPGCALVQLRKR